eukprot:gene12284-biopygen23496
MFHAYVHQLHIAGINTSHGALRDAVCEWLKANKNTRDGAGMTVLQQARLHAKNWVSWKRYVDEMELDATWGDAVTLYAIAAMLGVTFRLVNGGSVRTVAPSPLWHADKDRWGNIDAVLHIGHFATERGEHYVSIVDGAAPDDSVAPPRRRRSARVHAVGARHRVGRFLRARCRRCVVAPPHARAHDRPPAHGGSTGVAGGHPRRQRSWTTRVRGTLHARTLPAPCVGALPGANASAPYGALHCSRFGGQLAVLLECADRCRGTIATAAQY